MSFGGFYQDDDPGIFADKLDELLAEALIVAAAGNQHTCRPYFPAALPDVIGVGGLAADGRAWFSNYGGWVDACAPAIDVVSTFFQTSSRRSRASRRAATRMGALERDELRRAEGRRGHRPGDVSQRGPGDEGSISADQAWRRLSSHQRLRLPDLGVVVNVYSFPGHAGRDLRPDGFVARPRRPRRQAGCHRSRGGRDTMSG